MNTDFIQLLGEDTNIILYRPELNEITGSVTASILLQQFIYRAKSVGYRSFYKFKQPCNHKLYKEGDSWCEELGFSPKEFDTALSKIGFKYGNVQNDIDESSAFILYRTDGDRITWYELNSEILNDRLSKLYANRHLAKTEPKSQNAFSMVKANRHLAKSQNAFTYNKESENTKAENTTEEYTHVVLPEGKTTPLQIILDDSPSMLENLHTCQNEQDGCVSESENCVLEKSEEGSGAKIQFSEKFKINPTAENKFLGLSKTKQAKVVEVMEAFVDITGKRDGLTKERLGNILARLGEQVLSGDDEAVNVELKHFKAVFEYKNEDWQNDDKMRGYIQIETLCSGKFHKYIEEAREAYKNKQKTQGVASNQQPAKRKLGGIG